jgi:hypothetical protein
MYEEAIVLGLGMASLIFAYISSQLDSDKSGILKLLFLTGAAINTWILVNVCATIASNNGAEGIVLSNIIWENSSTLFLWILFVAALWLGVMLLMWVLQQLILMATRRKIKTPTG